MMTGNRMLRRHGAESQVLDLNHDRDRVVVVDFHQIDIGIGKKLSSAIPTHSKQGDRAGHVHLMPYLAENVIYQTAMIPQQGCPVSVLAIAASQ